MRARSFFALCLLPSAISGAALVSRSDLYNFDDLNVLKCGPLPLLPLGKYKGIEFQGFQALAPNSLYPPNVPSEPCIIATTLRAELLGGLFKWQPSLPGLQLPRFTIDYANSPYASFDLVSGRFGCFGAIALGSAPLVAECDLLFTGVGLDNKDKTSVFRHVGSANEYEEIEFGTEMENVKYVRIELLDIPFANAVKAVTADNLVLTLHAKN